jgi:hypothetical protein
MRNLFLPITAKCTLLFLLVVASFAAHAGKPGHPKIVCKTCNLNGPTTGFVGQAGMFVLTTGTTAGWTVTNGATIIRSTSNTVTVQFNNTGITNVETAGATCGGASINVSVTVQPLTAPSISESSGTINYGATPGVISSSGASGGSCGTSYSYAWYSSTNNSTWNLISGAGGLSYQPGALFQTTYFKQVVTCNGTATSNIVTITVYSQLVGGNISPSTQTINYNTTASGLTLSGVSGGNGSYTYQWQSSSNSSFSSPTNVGSGGTTYSPGPLTSTTYYRVVVTSNGVTTYSTTAIVNVYGQLIGGSISPPSQTINYNTTPSTLTLSGVSGGSGSYTYQWQSSPNSSFTSPTNVGSGGTTYSPGALTSTTYYRVAVTSNGVTAYSSTAVVNVYPQLAGGSISPSSQTINYNTTPSTLTLSGVSGGSGTYTYQWQSSPNSSFGSPTSVGSGGTTYSPGALTSTTYYRVAVTSNGVTSYSSIAEDSVYSQLTGGSISPSSQSINYNATPSTLTLSGVSGGSGTYTYQWQSSPNSSFGSPTNVGSGGTTYSPGALTSTTYYRVAVTSNGVTAYSSMAEDSVYSQLAGGSISPGSQTINYNTTPSTLTLSGVSGGSGTYTYQWQSSPNSSFTSPTNVGSGGTTYSPGALTSTTYYRVGVTSNGVTTYSSIAEDSVYAQLNGGSISPSSQTINNGATPSTLTLTGVSGGNGSYSYQWVSSPDNSTWTAISGQTGTSYSPPALTSTTYYEVVVTSNGVSGNSASATVTVYPQLQAGAINPNFQLINYNSAPSAMTLSGVSGGNGTYTYQWQWSTDFNTWLDLAGQTGTTFTSAALTQTTYFQVLVTSNGQTIASNYAEVDVIPQLLGGSVSPATQTINYNIVPAPVVINDDASGGLGSTSYSYQWQSSPDNSTWTNISGQTGKSYFPPALTATTYYRVTVMSYTESAYSASAVVNVYPQLQPGSLTPTTQTITSGSPATISLSGTSGGSGAYTYQWQSSYDNSSWTNVGGQTGTTYSPPLVSPGLYYRVAVTSNGVTAYTNSVNVMVNEPLTGGTITGPGGTIGYNTSPGTLGSAQDAYGGSCYPGDYRYQWQYSTDGVNFYNLSGATSSTYTPTTPLTASLYFRRQVSCSANTVNSNTIYVQVTPQAQQNCSPPH